MEGIYHINIIEVGCSRLIRHIYRVLERYAPYRKGLKFGIARLYSTLVLMVKLR